MRIGIRKLITAGVVILGAVLLACSTPAASPPGTPTTAPIIAPPPTATPISIPEQSTAMPTSTSVPPPSPTPAPEPTADEVISEIADFTLQYLTVNVGETVTWVNNDGVSHTTTAGTPDDGPSGEWDSQRLNQSQRFSFTFSEGGSFPYFCKIHISMTATVTVVEDDSGSTPTPAPTATNTPEAVSPTPTLVPETPTPAPEAATREVISEIFNYSLKDLTVNAGDTITWVNNHNAPHTVTSGTPPDRFSGHWDSGIFNQSQSFSFMFNETGAFPYYCDLHPQMIGTVTVVEGSKASPTPSPSEEQTPEAGSSTETPTAVPAPAPTSTPTEVQSSIFQFNLESLTVPPGTTITWTNNDSAAHTVTSGIPADGPSGEWDSGNLQQNQSFSHTFDEAGTFPYYCDIHEFMTGTIIVAESDSSDISSPTPGSTAQPTPPPQSDYGY
jgi:plastocyanin